MRLMRPLRLLVPLVAVGGALVLFLVFGFLAYQGGTGGGGTFGPQPPDPIKKSHGGASFRVQRTTPLARCLTIAQ